MISHRDLIINNGGRVIDNIVEEFGISIISKSIPSITADLQNVMNLSNKEDLLLEEINGKITYLSDSKKESFVSDILSLGHNISHGNTISLLITGIKESTVLELVSNKNFKCSRLTTSFTKASTDTLYAKTEIPKEYLDKFTELREEFLTEYGDSLGTEQLNEFNLETKVLSITIHCELMYLYEYIQKKLNNKYEYELKNVCNKILDVISEEPLIKAIQKENI